LCAKGYVMNPLPKDIREHLGREWRESVREKAGYRWPRSVGMPTAIRVLSMAPIRVLGLLKGRL